MAGYDVDDDSDKSWLFTDDALASAYGTLAPHAGQYVHDINTFIAQICNATRLPLLLCAASTLCSMRVFTKRPLDDPQRHAVATVCILLATEMDEYPYIRNETIVETAWRICVERSPSLAGEKDAFTRLVRTLTYPVFEQLNWSARTRHPYAFLPLAVADMRDVQTRHAVLRDAWLIVNESYLTNILLRFRPSVVACAAVSLAIERLESRRASASTLGRWAANFKMPPGALESARSALLPLLTGSLSCSEN